MPLTVEDGTGLADADTFATLAEANDHASLNAWSDWTAATDAQKEAALLEAALYLDTSYAWKGSIKSTTQALSWPRSGATDREGRTLSGVPRLVKTAQMELARLALAASLVTSETEGRVSQISAGSVSLSFKASQLPNEAAKYRKVDRMLSGLFKTRAASGVIAITRG